MKVSHVSFALSCAWILLLSIQLVSCAAEENDRCEYQKDDLEGIPATKGTVASFLESSEDKTGKEAIETLSKHFKIYKSKLEAANDSGLHCIDKVQEQNKFSIFLNWGEVEGCVVKYDPIKYYSKNETEKKDYEETSEDVINAIENLSAWMSSTSKNVIDSYSLGNITDSPWLSNDIFEYDESHARECKGYRAIGYQVNGKWKIGTILSNVPYDTDAKEKERKVFMEIVSANDGVIDNFPVEVPTCEDEVTIRNGTYEATLKFTDGTTRWDYGDRDTNSEPSHISFHFGIEIALGATARQKELLQDSGEPSNIAVLILPGLLALFPISLFQEANIGTVFLYSIVTDVVSVLPILIKAIELIYYGRKPYFGMHTQYHGLLDDKFPTVAQLMPAKCTFKSWIPQLGFALLAVGLGLMVFGISLEAVTLRMVKKRKNEWNSDPDNKPIKELHGLLWYVAQKRSKEKDNA